MSTLLELIFPARRARSARASIPTRRTWHGLALVAALLAIVPAIAAEWRKVPPVELRHAFVGHELGDGVHYAYQFLSDGTVAGYQMAREVHGTWRVADGEFCWTWSRPRVAEECFVIERQGADIRFLRDGSEFLVGKLSPVNQRVAP